MPVPTRLLLAAAFAIALGCHHYGAATPQSCHQKYVVDRRGDSYRDTYEACMTRAGAISEGIPEEVAKLRGRIAFETGCNDVHLTVLEYVKSAPTLVGADACGRRLMYQRQLRRHFGMRSTKNTQWELVGATPEPAPTRAAVPGPAPNITTVSDNPYSL